MNNQVALQHLKKASNHLTNMVALMNGNDQCINILRESKSAQAEIKAARVKLLDAYFEKCAKKLIENGREDVMKDVVKLFKYR